MTPGWLMFYEKADLIKISESKDVERLVKNKLT